jgi:hypothetical protein
VTITGWLSPDDFPDCGGPLLDVSTGPRRLTLACPGCGYSTAWHATDPTLPTPATHPTLTRWRPHDPTHDPRRTELDRTRFGKHPA